LNFAPGPSGERLPFVLLNVPGAEGKEPATPRDILSGLRLDRVYGETGFMQRIDEGKFQHDQFDMKDERVVRSRLLRDPPHGLNGTENVHLPFLRGECALK
jgi:hypothetical protein